MSQNIIFTVTRNLSEVDWTLSKFEIITGIKGFGVEDEKRQVKVKGETCIPVGIYELDLRYSPKFSKSYFVDKDGILSQVKNARFNKEHEMIWVKNVTNFEYVLIHWGNTDDDTDGCYIVGSTLGTFNGQKGVGGSRNKYTQIYPVLWKAITEAKAKGLKTYIEYK